MSVRVRKGGVMVDTMGHDNIGPYVIFEVLELHIYIYTYIYICISFVPSLTGGHLDWRPRKTTQASCCAQILVLDREPSPRTRRQDRQIYAYLGNKKEQTM